MRDTTRLERRSDYDRGFERCVVTFIDILGFRNLLNTRTAAEIAGVVNALRRFTTGDSDKDDPPRRMKECRMYSQSFSESVSDAVVRVRTVDTQSPDGAFILELIDLMYAMIECVNRGILIRGGMTIGPVHIGEDGKGPIFGNGMVRAFKIESEEANYPRIMIDDAALEKYLTDESLWNDGEIHSDEARLALAFLGVAEDGSHFVDYLRAAGPGEFDAGLVGQFEFLKRHRQLIVQNLGTEDLKARRKLVWLANYHNRFIVELREKYDMADTNGNFFAELEVAPIELFDSLMIEGPWTNVSVKLADIASLEP